MKKESAIAKKLQQILFLNPNAGNRTWTDTVLPPRDFKSLASAYSATPAYNIILISNIICYSFNKKNGAYRARTYDPLLVRQMLSQLS